MIISVSFFLKAKKTKKAKNLKNVMEENVLMKKFFVREKFFKSVTIKIKHNKLTLIAISIFLILIVSFIGIKAIQKSQNSNNQDIVESIGDNNNTSNNINNDYQAGNENTSTVKKEEPFIIPLEGIRPYAVMIDNEGVLCLPQGGLHKAQVIYEIIVEGGETRLMPIFWNSETDAEADAEPSAKETNKTDLLIGPVRSSRHYFLDYVLEHDAIYVHFGWSPKAMNDIPKLKINNINGVANGGDIFWDITKNPNNWQDSYTSMNKIIKYVEKVKYRTETDKKNVLSYSKKEIELNDGIDALNILIKYNQINTSKYIYDSEKKEYNRLRKGKPHMERTTEGQLKAKNIIIQFNKNYTIEGDKEDRQEVKTTGNGNGWYITNGKAIEINWAKKSRSEPTIYTDGNGNPINLNLGQTWIQVVPTFGTVEISNE